MRDIRCGCELGFTKRLGQAVPGHDYVVVYGSAGLCGVLVHTGLAAHDNLYNTINYYVRL